LIILVRRREEGKEGKEKTGREEERKGREKGEERGREGYGTFRVNTYGKQCGEFSRPWALEPKELSSNPNSITHQLCDFGHVTYPP
jgi:hypothetical protein